MMIHGNNLESEKKRFGKTKKKTKWVINSKAIIDRELKFKL
jgi:hypothetical protein